MHIPDGFLSKEVFISFSVVSVIGISIAAKRVKKNLDEKLIPIMGIMSAFVFVAQMVNFPVVAGTSAHFMGTALVAIMFGPAASVLIMSAVLIVQTLVFQDGGITALGANIFNMGIAAGVISGVINHYLRNFPKVAAFLAGFFSIVVASLFCAVELGISGTTPLKTSAISMVSIYSIIGVFEGVITVIVLNFIKKIGKYGT